MSQSGNAEEDDIYLVESIVDRRVRRGRVEYRVRWKGFPPEQDSWEPFTNLREPCLPLIQEFHNRYRKVLQGKKRLAMPSASSTSRTKASGRMSLDSYLTAFENGTKLRDEDITSERIQLSARTTRKNLSFNVHTLSTRTTPTSSLASGRSTTESSYSGSISINSAGLTPASFLPDDTSRIPSQPMNSTLHKIQNEFEPVTKSNETLSVHRTASLDSAVTTTSCTSAASNKKRYKLKTSDGSTSRRSKTTKFHYKTKNVPVSLTTCSTSQTSVTKAKDVFCIANSNDKQTVSYNPALFSTQFSRNCSKADPSSKESSTSEHNVESSRKSVTIMLKASPTQEFHSTKELQTQQSGSLVGTIATVPKIKAVRRNVDALSSSKWPIQTSDKFDPVLSHGSHTEMETPQVVPDADIAKVMDVVLQLRESRRRPIKAAVVNLCSRQYSLPEAAVIAALNLLVSQNQLHEIQITNGVSYRASPGIVARGDLRNPATLSAKIKAKYASGITKKKRTVKGTGVILGAKRPPNRAKGASAVGKRPRLEPNLAAARNSLKNLFPHGYQPVGTSLFGRALKPTRPHGGPATRNPSRIMAPGSSHYSLINHSDSREAKHRVHFPVDHHSLQFYDPVAMQGCQNEPRIFVVPPASPVRESNFELQLNSLPHRRLCQSTEFTGEANGKRATSSMPDPDATTCCSTLSGNAMLTDINPASATCSDPIPRRSSVRQTEAVYKFKSILVKKNIIGGFTEVWLQSPTSPLKNAFTIQVLEELTAMLNQAVYDTSRLVVISGMGTVFSSGIDLTALIGCLPSHTCIHHSPSESSASSVSSTSGFNYSTAYAPHSSTVPDQKYPTASYKSAETLCYCCCFPSDSTRNRSSDGNSRIAQPHRQYCASHLTPMDPMISQQLGAALRAFLLALVAFPKPIVVGVNGPAMGLAVAMLPLCDLVYVSDAATFQLPYTRLGQTPEGGSSFTLASLIGIPLANELLLAGRKLSAREAAQRGLVSDLLYPKSFKQELIMRCHKLASASPMALEMTKCIVRTQQRDRIEFVINTECRKLVELWQTAEFRRSAADLLLHDMGDFV